MLKEPVAGVVPEHDAMATNPYRRVLNLETCLMCDHLAPDRFQLVRSPDRFGNEIAPRQRRMAPLCDRCRAALEHAGSKGLVSTESGARWTLAAFAPDPAAIVAASA